MAIIPVGPPRNVQAVSLVVSNCQTYLRELVVTGTPTVMPTEPPPAAPTNVSASFSVSTATVTWTHAFHVDGYAILRSTNGEPYVTAGSTNGQVEFDGAWTDAQVQPDTSYTYEVIAIGSADSPPSAPSPALVTPSFGATATLFPNTFWQGTPTLSENVPLIDYSGGAYAPLFPLTGAFSASNFSTFIEGKITTDLAPPGRSRSTQPPSHWGARSPLAAVRSRSALRTCSSPLEIT